MDYTLLTQVNLFRGCDAARLAELFNELKIKPIRFRKDNLLAMQGERVNHLIILLNGRVKAEMIDDSGKFIKVEDLIAPTPLAILFLFGAHNRFPVQAIALEECEAVVIPKASVLRLLSMDEQILQNYLDISADFAARLTKKLHLMSFRSIRQKIASHLLEQYKRAQSDTFRLDRTKTALAEYFGVARQSLEREFTAMQNDGLIHMQQKQITLRDKSALQQLLER